MTLTNLSEIALELKITADLTGLGLSPATVRAAQAADAAQELPEA